MHSLNSSDKDFTIDLVEDSTAEMNFATPSVEISMWDHVILINPEVASRYQPVKNANLYLQNKTTMIYITKDLKENVREKCLIV